MAEVFIRSLRHTPVDRRESLLIGMESTLDPANASIPDDVALAIPVLQVIGSQDEIWGSESSIAYQRRLPNLRRTIMPGADHKASLYQADRFYDALAAHLRD